MVGCASRGIKAIKNRRRFFPAWGVREKVWAKICTAIFPFLGSGSVSAAGNMKNIAIEV